MKLIVLYGPPASGKFTIAKMLSEKIGYKLFHNHLTIDLLKSVFTWGTPDFFKLNQEIRLKIFEEAARQDIDGLIFTYVYEKDTDDHFIKLMLEKVTKYNGEVIFIQLFCEKEELLKRVTNESRKAYQKVGTEEGLDNWLNSGDMMSDISFVKNILIDNTNLSEDETFQKVIDALKKA